MNKHITVDRNTIGRDFVVGDIHGEFEQLTTLLSKVQFDKEIDRLFSVGDIVDRGPDSPACLELLEQPWFYMVLGNHEDMMITAVESPEFNQQHWYNNGGHWAKIYPEEYLNKYVSILKTLPFVITIKGLCHIVHAELIKQRSLNVTNKMVETWDFTKREEDAMLWGRRNCYIHGNFNDDTLLPVYVGHTIFDKYTIINGHHYLDQGAFMRSSDSDFSLAMINPVTQEYVKV